MTDRPISEPEPRDPRLDRDDEETGEPADVRPSAAEGEPDTTGGPRPPRPSQAEGVR